MQKHVALYLRVSTIEQTTQNQRGDLERAAERHGWTIAEVYEDFGISGAKGREKRPALNRMLNDAVRGKFDIIATWSVDRLGRSLIDLMNILGEIHGAGVELYLHQQGLDTTTPAGKAMFSMLGIFSEFERSIIQARIKAGLVRARAAGVRLGRKPISDAVVEKIKKLRRTGMGMTAIAGELGVGCSAVQRVCREMTDVPVKAKKTPKTRGPYGPRIKPSKATIAAIQAERRSGLGMTAIARKLGVGCSLVQRVCSTPPLNSPATGQRGTASAQAAIVTGRTSP